MIIKDGSFEKKEDMVPILEIVPNCWDCQPQTGNDEDLLQATRTMFLNEFSLHTFNSFKLPSLLMLLVFKKFKL